MFLVCTGGNISAVSGCSASICQQSCLYGGKCSDPSSCLCNTQSPPPPTRLRGKPSTPGTRFKPIPLMNETQQIALGHLLWLANKTYLPSAPGCNSSAVVCDDEGNVVEVNHFITNGSSNEALHINWNSMVALPLLRSFECNACQLKGTIPEQIALLSQLLEVDMFDNQLSGVLPLSIGSLQRLKRLVLASNGLQGSIPLSISSLGGLELLDLSFNRLSGDVPFAIGSLGVLKTLRLNDNSFATAQDVGGFSQLRISRLDHNPASDVALKTHSLQQRATDLFTDNLLDEGAVLTNNDH